MMQRAITGYQTDFFSLCGLEADIARLIDLLLCPPPATHRGVMGLVYILRFDRPLGNTGKRYGTAGWYVGWCEFGTFKRRLREHRAGRGAAITAAAVKAGIKLIPVACFNGTRADERRVKNYKNTRLFVERECWKPSYARRDTIPF